MVIYLTSFTNLAPEGLKMKVKGKHRKGAKMESFATAQPVYEFRKVKEVISYAGRFLKNKTYKDEDDNVKKVLEIQRQKNDVFRSRCFLNSDINKNINQLLRNILLFKGIGFSQIEKDVRIAGKPVTYHVNVELNVKESGDNVAAYFNTELKTGDKCSYVNRLKVYSITVRKTFRERKRQHGVVAADIDKMWSAVDELGVLFDGKSCRPIKDWYMLHDHQDFATE